MHYAVQTADNRHDITETFVETPEQVHRQMSDAASAGQCHSDINHAEFIVDSWPIQPDILNSPFLRLTSRKLLWLDLQPADIKSRWRHNWKSAQVGQFSPSVRPHKLATGFWPPSAAVVSTSSSSRMRVIYHNWSATKQRPHPQSVAEISRHSALSGDRMRQCETLSGSRHKDTDQCL